MASASFSDAESLRVNLETAISKLRKTLRYWQTWEAEYEGLKEELEAEKHEPSAEDIVRIGAEYGSHVVDEKEIKELVNYNKTTRRNRSQVLSAISGRIDTGQKNAELVQKQIDRAQNQLELAMASNRPQLSDEGRQPLMEIEEELDEDGNIVRSKLSNVDKSVGQMRDVLQRVEAQGGKGTEKQAPKSDQAPQPVSASNDEVNGLNSTAIESKGRRPTKNTSPSQSAGNRVPSSTVAGPAVKKTEGSKASLPSKLPPDHLGPSQKSTLTHRDRIVELDDGDELSRLDDISNDISPEMNQSETRRELHEHLQQYGPVVATLDIESDEDELLSDDEYEDDDIELEENEYGMNNIHDQLSPKYLKEMEELLMKHSPEVQNVGPSLESVPTIPEGILKHSKSPVFDDGVKKSGTARNEGTKTKGVKFAEELDISPGPAPKQEESQIIPGEEPSKPVQAPLSSTIRERAPVDLTGLVNTPRPTKVSRFKAAKTAKTAGSTRTESSSPPRGTAPEIDEAAREPLPGLTLTDELAQYHQRMDAPNREIDRSQFRESEHVDEDDYDEKPKMSRFKASRLGL